MQTHQNPKKQPMPDQILEKQKALKFFAGLFDMNDCFGGFIISKTGNWYFFR
jgi:hypothetical protein